MIHMLYPRYIRVIAITVISIVLNSAPASGQRNESLAGFMVGLRANAVKGDVVYQREHWKFALDSGLELEEADFIRSGANAYAELLLDPGNFLRMGSETECQIFSEQHDKMRLRLNHGSISFEIL